MSAYDELIARNTCSQLGKDMLCHVELCKSFGEIVCMHVIVYMVSCTSVQFMYVHVFITYATCMNCIIYASSAMI